MRWFPVLATIALSLAAPAFDRKAFPNWDERTVYRLLTDSAWAKTRTVKIEWLKKEDRQPISYKDIPGADKGKPIPDSYGSPVGGVGTKSRTSQLPDRADVIIRWASALPVRQAKAVYKQRDEKASAEKLAEWVGTASADYELEIFGIPALVAHQGAGSIEHLVRQSAYLITRSGRKIAPARVQADVGGTSVTVTLQFPKTEELRASDGEVEVFADFQLFSVREKFKLSAMTYEGRLEM